MKPSFSTQHELRFGTKGSLSINTKDNTWFDFEAQTGGGMLDFLVHCGRPKVSKTQPNGLRNTA
jgi:hypothetical protein